MDGVQTSVTHFCYILLLALLPKSVILYLSVYDFFNHILTYLNYIHFASTSDASLQITGRANKLCDTFWQYFNII